MKLDDFHSIQSPMQEVQFWKDRCDQTSTISAKDASVSIYDTLKNVIPVFQYLDSCDISVGNEENDKIITTKEHENRNQTSNYESNDDIELYKSHHRSLDYLEKNFTDGNCIESALYSIFQVVDDGGNFVYTASRMEHFIKLISQGLCKAVHEIYPVSSGMFAMDATGLKTLVVRSKDILMNYLTMIGRLTKIDFSLREKDPWIQMGGCSRDGKIDKLLYRIDTFYSMRATYDEILYLLPSEKKSDVERLQLLELFGQFDPLDVFNNECEKLLKSTLQIFDTRLKPLDCHIAKTIQDALRDLEAPPFVILSTLEKVSHVLQRPGVMRGLHVIISRLSDTLKALLVSIDQAIDDSTHQDGPVEGIFMCRGCKRKLQKIRIGFKPASLNNDIEESCKLLEEKCQNYEYKIFKFWMMKVEHALDLSLKTLEQNHTLIELHDSKTFRVTLHDELAIILDEERKLKLLGFNTDRIEQKVTIGKKYFKMGSFINKAIMMRNHIEQRVSREEREFIVNSLVEFDDLLNKHCETLDPPSTHHESSSIITWTNNIQCEKLALKLNNIANKLSSEIKKVGLHRIDNSRRLCTFFGYDLLSQKSSWLRHCSDCEESLCEQTTDMPSKWATYWGHQIMKIFDASYARGLGHLNKVVQDIRCEMIMNGGKVDIHPSLSEIRIELYAQLRSFIEYPVEHKSALKGMILFKVIPRIHESTIARVFNICERYISDLKGIIAQYAEKVVPYFDMASYVRDHCRRAGDFSVCFQWLKSQMYVVENWPEMETIHLGMKLSLRKFKMIVADRLLFLEDSLNDSLQKSALCDYQLFQEYLTATSLLMTNTPTDINGIIRVENDWKAAKLELLNIERISASGCDKFDLLIQFYRSNLESSESFRAKKKELMLIENKKWASFIDTLNSFAADLLLQKETAKAILLDDIRQMEESIYTLESKWKSSKASARDNEICNELDVILIECCALVDRRKLLHSSCISLNVQNESFLPLENLYIDIIRHKEVKEVLIEFDNDQRNLYEMKWKGFNWKVFIEFMTRWKSRVKGLSHTAFIENISTKLVWIDECSIVLESCRGDAYKDEHWTDLFYNILCLPREISFKDVAFSDLMRVRDKLLSSDTRGAIEELQRRALEEITLRESLDEVVVWFNSFYLVSIDHHSRGRCTHLVSNLIENSCAISEQLDILSSLKESVHYQSISDLSSLYEMKLLAVSQIIEKLNIVQRKWLYLEPIYANGTMTINQDVFESVDATFRSIMSKNKNGRLKQLVEENLNPDLNKTLDVLIVELEQCQQSLYEFLEEKRFLFPRLYFIGDESLLELLTQSKQPDMIQTHIKHLFQAIHRVVFDSPFSEVVAFRSVHNEEVVLKESVKVRDSSVEMWLKRISEEQIKTLQQDLILSLDSSCDRDLMESNIPSQIQLLCDRIKFAQRIDRIFQAQKETLGNAREHLNQKVQELSTKTAATTNGLNQRKEHALIVQLIHHRDVVDKLIKCRCCHSSDWIWQSQLRFTFTQDKCHIIIGDASFNYTFEYQGNEESLVHTALTDKCYLNLTQAIRFGYGGNVFGPAGTGKTETVKALGTSMGRQVLVFNCDDELNYKSIGRILIGLVMSGAWGCFDEFNRLKEDQLSAIADQIQSIQDALKRNEEKLLMLQKNIPINHNVGVFITMNPVGSDYGGRSALPSNLKSLFRPVAMGFPDKLKIVEVALLSDGFHNAYFLGVKLIHIFSSARDMLTNKRYYDWSLRSIKSVVRSAGKNRRMVIIETTRAEDILETEKEIIMSSIRDSIIGKLSSVDSRMFQTLLSQTFWSCAREHTMNDSDIVQIMRREEKYNEHMIHKVIQLQKALNERIGCIILGRVLSGKSFVWRALKSCMKSCGRNVESHALNPKALTRTHLFGILNVNTGEWKDGVITSLVRRALLTGDETETWIVFDGDVDPEWIESLNSVLDDNRLLTLPTGERLRLNSRIKFIFETRDLTFASPATISRNAIICMDGRDRTLPPQINVDKETLSTWIHNSEHFTLVGPMGSGRDSLIYDIISHQSGTEVSTIYCNEEIMPDDVITCIEEICSRTLTPNGVVYRPKTSKKISLVLKDIQCLSFDRYGSCCLCEFFNHLFDYGGFYDLDTTFCRIEGIQVIFISTSIEALTGQNIHTFERLAKNMRIGIKTLPMVQDTIDITYALLDQRFPKTTLSQRDEHANRHLAALIVNALSIAQKETYEQKRSFGCVPFYILVKCVLNLTKYSNYTELEQNCIAYEARRSIENMIFDCADSTSIHCIVRKVFDECGIDLSSSCGFFHPLSTSIFSLVLEKDARVSVLKSLEFLGSHELELGDEVIQALSDIQHALFTGSKNILLLGDSGSGRKTLMKLACQMNSIEYVTLMMTTNWDAQKFKSQLLQLIVKAGIEDERICVHIEEFMLTETQMTSILCQILSGGDSLLYSFFDPKHLKDCLSRLNHRDGRLDKEFKLAKQLFMSNIKSNMHICISLNLPLNKANKFFRNNPSLKRYTEVVLVKDWSDKSMRNYIQNSCTKVLSKVHVNNDMVVDTIFKLFKSIEATMGSALNNLMEFIEFWSRLFSAQNEELQNEISHLIVGINKLDESNNKVMALKLQSSHAQQTVMDAQFAADKAMKEITTEMTKSQMKIHETKELKLNVAKRSEDCNARKDVIESQIATIRPVLEASKDAVKGIKREHLNEIKSFKTPPQPICDVLSGVLMLLGIDDLSWNSMKGFLSKRGVIQDILDFDVKMISKETKNKVQRLVSKKKQSFEKSVIARVSVAAAPLAAWVIANLEYMNVLITIKPLEIELNEMRNGLEECEIMLASCETSMKEIDDRVHSLKSEFLLKTKEAERLKIQLEIAMSRSESAANLMNQLDGEKQRWLQRRDNLEQRTSSLWVELLMFSTFVIYLGHQSEDMRVLYKKQWIELLRDNTRIHDLDFDALRLYKKDLSQWKRWGLHPDNFSRENAAIIASRSGKVSYIIDPNDMALSWLKNLASNEKSKSLEIAKACDEKLSTKVEFCVKSGRSLIIKDCAFLDPYLYPLLRGDISYEDSRHLVTLGSKRINYNKNFELFLLSKINVGVPSHLVRIVDFTITQDGLKNRLLSILIKSVMPNLEDDLRKWTELEELNFTELSAMETKLLDTLCAADGDLLENEGLIETLIITKENATKMSSTLVEINVAKDKVQNHYEEWADIADTCSNLYSLLQKLHVIDHFYRFSIESFELFFTSGLESSYEMKKLNMDKSLLLNHIVRHVLLTCVSAIKNEDRVAYFLHIAKGMHPELWKKKLWVVFLKKSFSESEYEDTSFPEWADVTGKNFFGFLKKQYPEIMQHSFESKEWKLWANNSDDIVSNFPINVSDEERLLLIKTFRSDHLNKSVAKYCMNKIGIESIHPLHETLSQHWNGYLKESSLPVMFITGPENDPGSEIEALAGSLEFRFICISLGDAFQNDIILTTLRRCAHDGVWICLKNLHLAINFLPALERELDEIYNDCHDNFRLWFTSEKRESISSALIERSYKIVCDSPTGLKENVKQILGRWEEMPSSINQSKKDGFKESKSKLLFLLAWSHSILQERGSFGHHGWELKQEFTAGDLFAAEQIIDRFHAYNNGADIIRFYLLHFIYGGKIGNHRDEGVVKAYIETFFSDDVLEGRSDLFPGFRINQQWDDQSQYRATRDIPITDAPSLFGLPDNILRSVQTSLGFQTLCKIQKMESTRTEDTSNLPIWHNSVVSIIQHWKDTSTIIGNFESNEEAAIWPDDPYHQLIQQERFLGQSLIKTVVSSINLLQDVVDGTLDSDSLEFQKLYTSICNKIVPNQWKALWNGPTDVMLWMVEMMKKKNALDEYRVPSDICGSGISINISSFFNPSGFLCAMKQKVATEKDWEMDKVIIFSQFEPSNGNEPDSIGSEYCISIDGLFLKGCTLNEKIDGNFTMHHVKSSTPDFQKSPPIKLIFLLQSDSQLQDQGNTFLIPVRSNVLSDKVLFHVTVGCKKSEALSWTLAGVGLYLESYPGFQ